jgi:hypothetical protein
MASSSAGPQLVHASTLLYSGRLPCKFGVLVLCPFFWASACSVTHAAPQSFSAPSPQPASLNGPPPLDLSGLSVLPSLSYSQAFVPTSAPSQPLFLILPLLPSLGFPYLWLAIEVCYPSLSAHCVPTDFEVPNHAPGDMAFPSGRGFHSPVCPPCAHVLFQTRKSPPPSV